MLTRSGARGPGALTVLAAAEHEPAFDWGDGAAGGFAIGLGVAGVAIVVTRRQRPVAAARWSRAV